VQVATDLLHGRLEATEQALQIAFIGDEVLLAEGGEGSGIAIDQLPSPRDLGNAALDARSTRRSMAGNERIDDGRDRKLDGTGAITNEVAAFAFATTARTRRRSRISGVSNGGAHGRGHGPILRPAAKEVAFAAAGTGCGSARYRLVVRTRRAIVSMPVFAAVAACCIACESQHEQNWARLQRGLTKTEVEQLLGEPSSRIDARREGGDVVVAVDRWQYGDNLSTLATGVVFPGEAPDRVWAVYFDDEGRVVGFREPIRSW